MARFNRLRGRRQPDALDELARSLRTKEPTAWRKPVPRQQAVGLTSRGLQVLGAMAVIALAALVISAVMLWRIADKPSSGGEGVGKRAAVSPPPLPPAGSGSSTTTLSREFDNLSSTFVTELDRVNAQLASAANAPAALQSQFSGAAQDLGVVANGVGAFGGASRSLGKVARSTSRLAAVQTSLRKMRRDLSELDTVSGNTGAMNASITAMNGQLGTLDALNSQLQSMNTSVQPIAPMNASIGAMSQSMETLNTQMAHMSATMDAICKAFKVFGAECPE